MGWADSFAEGFAAGFVPTYTAGKEREAEQEERLLEARIEAAQTYLSKREEQALEDAKRRRQAQTIVNTVGKGDMGLAYQMLETYEDPEVVTEMLRDNDVTQIEMDVNSQTDEAFDFGPSRQDIINQSEGPTVEAAGQLEEADQITSQLTADIIREFEGYRESPYFDVNAQRAGYGSDTVTREEGSVVPVQEGMRVSREDAERDLTRRINQEFLPSVRNAVGDEAFNQLSANQKAALTSLAYNYGANAWENDLSGIRDAIAEGDMDRAAREIAARSEDNDGINARRRQQEAALFAGGPVRNSDPTDQQMQESGLASGNVEDPLYNPENDRQDEERGFFSRLFSGGKSVDTRFREYMQETGQWESYQAARSGSLLTDTPVTSYRLNTPANSGVDLDNYIGKSTAEIDQQLIADEGRITEDDLQRINGIREVQLAEENNSNFWNDPSELSEKTDGFLQSFIALTDSNEARDRALTALEARQSGDTPTSPKDAAFTEFYRNLPDDLSPEERQESFAVFENTWKQSTSSEGQFDIFAELADRDSVSELTALRTAINNNPELEQDRGRLLSLVDTAINNLNDIQSGDYDLNAYQSDIVRYTRDLTSGTDEERQAALEWFETEQPALKAGLQAAQEVENDLTSSALVDAGVPEDIAALVAVDGTDLRADRFGRMGVWNRYTGERISGPATGTAGGDDEQSGVTGADIIPDPESTSTLSDPELQQQIDQETAALEEAVGGEDVASFEQTLANIDVSTALGGPGMAQAGVNKFAALFGANAPFEENRRAANAMERLQRITSLTLAQSQANQRGSVALMNEFRQNAVAPNEIIGLDGALDKFRANYNLLNDQVQRLDRVRTGQVPATTADESRANQVYAQLSKLRDYYGVLVTNIEEKAPEPSGEDYVSGGGQEQTSPTSGDAGRRERRETPKTQAQAIREAREAISKGVPEAVARQRLKDEGYDPSGL